MKKDMRRVVVNKGKYAGFSGMGDYSVLGYKECNNIMFYPDCGKPYRVCLNIKESQIKETK